MFELSKKGKFIYWLFVVGFFSVILLLGYLDYQGFQNHEVKRLVVFILCILILTPLFSEIEIFGVKLKHQLSEIKYDIEKLTYKITNSNSNSNRQYIENNINVSNSPGEQGTTQSLVKEVDNITKVPKNSLITSDLNQLFWYSQNGKRYVFPNTSTFATWYPLGGLQNIYRLSQSVMSSIQLGGNITYKPGVKLLRLLDNPKVYAVARKRTLREFITEDCIKELYGNNWKYFLDILPDAFFGNYRIGAPINESTDYYRDQEINAYSSLEDLIEDDLS